MPGNSHIQGLLNTTF